MDKLNEMLNIEAEQRKNGRLKHNVKAEKAVIWILTDWTKTKVIKTDSIIKLSKIIWHSSHWNISNWINKYNAKFKIRYTNQESNKPKRPTHKSKKKFLGVNNIEYPAGTELYIIPEKKTVLKV